jgi:hypothetical protein
MDDARLEGDLRSLQAVRVARSIEVLVLRPDDGREGAERPDLGDAKWVP